ncbi:hypothetical protein BV898_14100 [Hypsibius exemplaris]|uniref:Thyrotropin-releasing hormone receptor n=1 Tax=Hypsibius exemplaris TaxID=2072580 RepID=A0A1W0W8W9_HYPEX|nr:hypothetical protein BV898_14100 [Hypsibius exemplaris]
MAPLMFALGNMTETNSVMAEPGIRQDSLGLTYLITVEVVHIVIFLLGIVGNGGLILTVFKTSSLHSTTLCYLVFLPEVVLLPSVSKDWVLALGGVGCSLVIYLRCVGRNAGSLIVMAFTVERYTAVCRPLLAQRHGTLPRAKKIIIFCFLLVIVECLPWMGLAALPKIDPAKDQPSNVDFTVFYVTLLLVALTANCRIGKAIARSSKVRRSLAQFQLVREGDSIRSIAQTISLEVPSGQLVGRETPNRPVLDYGYLRGNLTRAKHQGNIMVLVGVVVTSALSCLPLRGLFVYNAFAD